MKKFVIPIAAIFALTAMAIAFSSMTAPKVVQQKAAIAAPAVQEVSEDAPLASCCEKDAPAVVAEKEDCTSCDEAKKADCDDCAEKATPQNEAVSL